MRLIDYGRIAKSHGLSGGLKLVSLSGDLSALKSIKRIYVKTSGASAPRSFDITEKTFRAKDAIIKLRGVETPSQAQGFHGAVVMVEEADLPPAADGEYYDFQLTGLRAVTRRGEAAGEVESVLHTGLQSVLVISKTGGGDLLVPLVEKFIERVDISAGEVVVRNTEMLEENQ